MWYIPQVDAEYVARMEDVLDLHAAEEPNPKRLVVCFDDHNPSARCASRSLPLQASSNIFGCEYKRNGTANLFIFLDVHRPWRKVKVTERRSAEDYAHRMREVVDVHECIRVVEDNLST